MRCTVTNMDRRRGNIIHAATFQPFPEFFSSFSFFNSFHIFTILRDVIVYVTKEKSSTQSNNLFTRAQPLQG